MRLPRERKVPKQSMFVLSESISPVYLDFRNQGPCRTAGPFQLSTDNHHGLPYQNILTAGLDF